MFPLTITASGMRNAQWVEQNEDVVITGIYAQLKTLESYLGSMCFVFASMASATIPTTYQAHKSSSSKHISQRSQSTQRTLQSGTIFFPMLYSLEQRKEKMETYVLLTNLLGRSSTIIVSLMYISIQVSIARSLLCISRPLLSHSQLPRMSRNRFYSETNERITTTCSYA